MDYFFTTSLNLIGIMYMVMLSIKKLRAKYPQLHPKTIFNTFFSEEWDSMITSLLGLVLFELVLFIIRHNEATLPEYMEMWGIYVLAAVWGYASQRLAYSIFNTSEAVLQKKIDKLNDDNG